MQIKIDQKNKTKHHILTPHACLLAALMSVGSATASAQTICVFDLGGASGEIFALMKDYALAAKQWKVDITLKSYSNEDAAAAQFASGKCDGLVVTSFLTRKFNNYTGTINAIGAIPSNAIARTVLGLMGNPKVAADMVEGQYEASGIIPIGSAYFVMKDRTINTLAKIEGKRIGALSVDPIQQRMLQRVGGKPVSMTFDNGGEKFKSSEMDILPAPAMAFAPLEVYRTIGSQGGISRFPMSFISLNLIIKHNAFPQGYGQTSRTWFASNAAQMMGKVAKAEASVPKQYWFDVPTEDQVGYLKILRQMRLEFVRNKTYNPKMIGLLKKLRCQQDTSNYECGLKDE
jgi:hypothetical protein